MAEFLGIGTLKGGLHSNSNASVVVACATTNVIHALMYTAITNVIATTVVIAIRIAGFS